MQSKMDETLVRICAHCWNEDDSGNVDNEVEWIACEMCGVWNHIKCVSNDGNSSTYYCNRCSVKTNCHVINITNDRIIILIYCCKIEASK